jgi:hypothetical protein
METKEVFAQLIKQGAKQVKDVTIKNVTVTPQDEYIRLGLTLNKEVDGFKQEEDGTYTPAPTKVIFVSAFSVAALLKENDDAAFAANHLIKHPDALGMILSRAKITIVQQEVKEGSEYKNPFSDSAEPVTFDHDVIINHISDIELSDFGKKRLERLADMMLGF